MGTLADATLGVYTTRGAGTIPLGKVVMADKKRDNAEIRKPQLHSQGLGRRTQARPKGPRGSVGPAHVGPVKQDQEREPRADATRTGVARRTSPEWLAGLQAHR